MPKVVTYQVRGVITHMHYYLNSYDGLENSFSPLFNIWIQSVISSFARLDSRGKKKVLAQGQVDRAQ